MTVQKAGTLVPKIEKLEWLTQQRKINDLIPLDRNPFGKVNREKRKRLENKINRLGIFEIPTIDLDNTLLTFNKRRHALVTLGRGEEMIDVRVPIRALTKEERQEVILASNVHEGAWDKLILEEDFSNLDLAEVGINIEELEIEEKRLIEDASDPSNAQPDPEQLDIEESDVFDFVGEGIRHRLVCGDSTNADHVDKLLKGANPVLMVTDPPYGVKYDPSWRNEANVSNSARTGKVLNDDKADWTQTYALFPGNVAYVWHGGRHAHTVARNLEDCGFDIVAQIIWNKQSLVFGRGDYHWKHEPCWYAVKNGQDNWQEQKKQSTRYADAHETAVYAVKKGEKHNYQGDRTQSTVWDIKNLNSSRDEDSKQFHGTQKPIDCMAIPIQNNSAIGDDIYDPFGGSGTTLIAAHQLRRNCYIMELDKTYVHNIVERVRKIAPDLKVYKNGQEI